MHVMFVTSCLQHRSKPFGGCFTMAQAAALRAAGHRVSVLYDHWLMPDEVWPWLLRRLTETSHHPSIPIIDVVSPFGLPLLSRYAVGLRAGALIRAFKRYIERYGRPDVLHAHFDYTGGIICRKLSRLYGIPFGITEHSSYYLSNTVPRLRHRALTLAWKNASFRIAVSETLADTIARSHCLQRTSIDVVGNTLRDDFVCGSGSSPKDNIFRLCCVGALIARKRFDLAIESTRILAREGRAIRLTIVGEGPNEQRLRRSAAAGELGSVEFVGARSSSDLRELLLGQHALVISSDHETFGVVGIEALACGLPVVSTRCGGPSSYISSDNGVLVKKGSATALADGVRSLMDQYELYDRQALQASALSTYGAQAIADRLVAIYARCSP
jgi:glycosyltransferase involved in cell wall biosynthesis